jgi:catechol 2,3-dioxygenase-like lactoylglutathione lyase family enzyme
VIHHVGIEVRPADVERTAELFELLGFERVEPPSSLAPCTWLERGGTQVHLLPADDPAIPAEGHVAVVAPDFEASFARIAAAGFEIERRRQHWGAPRAKATAPGGQIVELMESPPGRAVI